MKKIILLLCVLSSCCIHREDGAKVLYENGRCAVIRANDGTMILVTGISPDLTVGGYKKYRQEDIRPTVYPEVDGKLLRKNRLSEASKEAFQRANAAFDSIYPGWRLRLYSYPVFLNGE